MAFPEELWRGVLPYVSRTDQLRTLSSTCVLLRRLTDQKKWAALLHDLRVHHTLLFACNHVRLVVHSRQLPWQQHVAWMNTEVQVHGSTASLTPYWPRVEAFLQFLHPDGAYVDAPQAEDYWEAATVVVPCCGSWRCPPGTSVKRVSWQPDGRNRYPTLDLTPATDTEGTLELWHLIPGPGRALAAFLDAFAPLSSVPALVQHSPYLACVNI